MTKKGEISTGKAWKIVLISLIDEVIVIALIILGLWYFKIKLPLWGMIALGVGLAAYVFIRTWAVIPSLRRRKITGSEGMIGLVGEVVESTTEEITVRVAGEYWQAECADDDMEAGEEVEVVGIHRLKLEIRRKVSWE